MGLAASQARLLTITARKSDCEFQSMSLSHQKIALSRDMDKISDEYQKAMSQTKLVYDYYGMGTSEMPLTYGLLMSPSIYNDYYPKTLTDAKNRVILNSSFANAARLAGIPVEGLQGTPSSDVRNAFIEALAGENIISVSEAATIESITYANTVGIGSTAPTNIATTEVDYSTLLDLIEANCLKSADWVSGDGSGSNLVFGENLEDQPYRAASYASLNKDGEQLYKNNNGTIYNTNSLSLTELLYTASGDDPKDHIIYSLTSNGYISRPFTEAALLQEKIVGDGENAASFLNWLTDQFGAILGGTVENEIALQAAYDAVYELLYPNSKIQDALGDIPTNDGCSSRYESGYYHNLIESIGMSVGTSYKGQNQHKPRDGAKDYIGCLFTSSPHRRRGFPKKGSRSVIAIDLTNITQVFLTAFVESAKGAGNSDYVYGKGAYKAAKLYSPKNDDFKFTIVTDTSDESGSVDGLFYDSLFNQICTKGWTENGMVDDPDYLQEALKSGMMYISSMGNDGTYYQSGYSTEKYISEVADTSAIAQAEAKYNTEKAKIEAKENRIDVKMKNLDTEISSLTTEYDTIKNIINKSIEKSFKRYDA